jgi:hypothetical protein
MPSSMRHHVAKTRRVSRFATGVAPSPPPLPGRACQSARGDAFNLPLTKAWRGRGMPQATVGIRACAPKKDGRRGLATEDGRQTPAVAGAAGHGAERASTSRAARRHEPAASLYPVASDGASDRRLTTAPRQASPRCFGRPNEQTSASRPCRQSGYSIEGLGAMTATIRSCARMHVALA